MDLREVSEKIVARGSPARSLDNEGMCPYSLRAMEIAPPPSLGDL